MHAEPGHRFVQSQLGAARCVLTRGPRLQHSCAKQQARPPSLTAILHLRLWLAFWHIKHMKHACARSTAILHQQCQVLRTLYTGHLLQLQQPGQLLAASLADTATHLGPQLHSRCMGVAPCQLVMSMTGGPGA